MAYLLEEDYEGDMSRWVIDDGSNGIVDPTYTTNPIFGSRSLRMKDDTTVGTYCVTRIDPDAGYNEFYAFFAFKPVDLPSSDSEIWQTYNLQAADTDYSDIEPHEIIMVTTDGRLKVWFPDYTNYTGSTYMSTGTPYYIWFYRTCTAGKLSSGWIKISDTQSIPASNDISWTDVGMTAMTYRGTNTFGHTMYHGMGYEYVADRMLISETAIGNAAFGATLALTGTAAASITEADIVTGGKTIILTLTGGTWIPA